MSIVKPTIVEKWQKKNKYGRPGTPLNYTKVAIHYTGEADVKATNTYAAASSVRTVQSDTVVANALPYS